MMVVVVMVMMPIARHHDDAVPVCMMMMVVVMVVVTADPDNDLGQLDVRVRRLSRSRFIDGLQQSGRVRDGFEQVGE